MYPVSRRSADEARGGSVHTGEREVREADLTGLAVHIGSRVVSQAGPSEICVTSTVNELVTGSELNFTELGDFSSKGIPDLRRLLKVDRE